MPKNLLSNPHTLIIFTTAPAGLGHLRITRALMDGLPDGLHSFMLGATDKTLTFLHRISSVNPFLLQFQNFIQYQPLAEQVFTDNYRSYLRENSTEIYYQLSTLLNSHHPQIKKAIIVATHFSLAHQIAEVKFKLEQESGCELILAVIVTDDTFQKIWAVDGADFFFVPSTKTKVKYNHYFNQKKLKRPNIIVNPYPISPKICQISSDSKKFRLLQLDPETQIPTQILIPISGAAVQLDYLQVLIESLNKEIEKPYFISVIAKKAPFTQSFLHFLQYFPNVKINSGTTNSETIDAYEKALTDRKSFALEITKPSEQAFKALLSPNQAGGVILLFTPPLGRQEVDNLDFLHKNNLLPSNLEQTKLENLASNKQLSINPELLFRAKNWRGIMLPSNPFLADKLINFCRNSGILAQMLKYQKKSCLELGDNGVPRFWQIVSDEFYKYQ